MRLLLVTSRYPWPPRRGDQLRAARMLEDLAPHHEVTLLAPSPPEGAPPPPAAAPYGVELYRPPGPLARAAGVAAAAAAGRPLQSGLFHAPDLSRHLCRLAPSADLAILQLARLAPHLKDVAGVPLMVDFIDSLALGLRARAAVDRPWRRPLLRLEAARLERWEGRLAASARLSLVVAVRDRRAVLARCPGAETRVLPLAVEPAEAAGEGPSQAPPTVAFTGNLGYFVNADALRWWLREVWPPLCRRRPDLRLVVAGARPPRWLGPALARAGGELVASPPDLEAVLARATVAVAPLRCGSGMPLKILEAWRLGVPVVASPWAAAGTTGRPGRDLLVAEEPAAWVEAILDLLAHPARRQALADAGRRRLAADYAPARLREELLAAVAVAGDRAQSAAPFSP